MNNIVPRFGRNLRSGLLNLTKRRYTVPNAAAPASSPAPPSPPPPVTPRASFESNHKLSLTKSQKYMCVWAKRFPSFDEVPDQVAPEVWSKVRSIIRIKLANITMVTILVGCVVMVVTGKRARDRGETIMQRNLEWHQKYAEGKEDDIKNIGVFGK